MEVTEEQRRRAEANRLAAMEKRKRAAERSSDDPWRLFRCRKIPSPTTSSSLDHPKPSDPHLIMKPDPPPPPPPPARFRIFIEICSPDEFSITPQPIKGFLFPGEFDCFGRINTCLSLIVPCRLIENGGVQTSVVFKIQDHESVLRCLKTLSGVELQDIPHITLSVVKKFQDCIGNQWKPLLDSYYSDEQVDEYFKKMPNSLRDALLPFQFEGVKFGLRRGGRCLIADEMGLGKTIQAIAIACCFHDEGPILVVCPAVLRFSWAEELERWLPFLLPRDIHLVFGHQDNLNYMERSPKVVVISYTMLSRLRESMLKRRWALLIVDESHNLRCTKRKTESVEAEAVLEVAAEVNRIILLSGTPSLSRPFDIYHQINMLWPRLLGKDKYEFAKNYCLMKVVQGCQGKSYMDLSKGIRLEELNVLLSQVLMIRRLKEHVLTQLPPKRRQIIRLKLKKADMPQSASSRVNYAVGDKEHLNGSVMNWCSHEDDEINVNLENLDVCHVVEQKKPKQLSNQEIGLAKLCGFREWFSSHAIIRESEDATSSSLEFDCQKMVIFAHHLKVLDGIQEIICEKRIQFIRIDGGTLARDRQLAVETFHQSKEVKIAIIGITAGGVGLDFSSAQTVVFLELPRSASEMLQAEDRAHRRGQKNAVNIYVFCAKDTLDESHWIHLNRSLFCVSSLINGKDDAVQEIKVDKVFHLDTIVDSSDSAYLDSGCTTDCLHNDNSDIEQADVQKSSSVGGDSLLFEAEIVQHPHSKDEVTTPRGDVGLSNCKPIEHRKSSIVASGFDLVESVIYKVDNRHSGTNDIDDGSPVTVDANANCSIHVDTLRFEVSQYTGRIHLYICIPGKDSRPRPLFVNFRPEELGSMLTAGSSANMKHGTAQQHLKENPSCYSIIWTFSNEWNGLRPIQRNKLLGKPLQLPLSLELCYLNESINHGSGGILRGGSKRRVTPLSSIGGSLPENAVWKKVSIRSTAKGKEYFQAWTNTDEPLCKLCQRHCNGKLSKTPEYFEDLFCNLSCFQEYRIRTSRKALREELFQVEHGVCTQCKLDCHKLVKCIKPLSTSRRKEYVLSVAPHLAKQKKLFEKLVSDPSEGNAWHADHIIPVYKGGGECTLENMRTLCVVCHAEVSKCQQRERKLCRQRAKEQLKVVLKEVKDSDHIRPINLNPDEIGEGNVGDEAAEDELLSVKVPGSAYSTTESN